MMRLLVLGLLVFGATACSTRGTTPSFDPEELRSSPGWIAVNGVPVSRQTGESDSGIAALTMIFGYWGIDEWSRDRVATACPVIAHHGNRARDLRACAREAGLDAHLVHGAWEDLVHELRAGRPVIVGLVKSYRKGPMMHYEVVVAVHPHQHRIVTLDPAHGWRENTAHAFLVEWEASTGLLLVFQANPPVPVPQTARR
jgi:ABC-type bacteriocin/lantibiotic exporter with double-glycine peptidase domain